uniref:Midasin n=1 Tax=Chromera velia CCMP2878 TaxID=1169474 RepID=A0A0G4GEL3_9ALVE|eukprot:Cvel_21523.t1-p1 / transcript=Cvel_21523.t1 / gene=Cvel_21523 / organism=Chromera_velia_CCMP2878 / gene_product=Midasin, putative / transcript_product=Midasin, putative / location=Cvel_scaffold2026:26764-33902(-) / protein_length=1870 / sequence_SO=supercontig / SO=protein_coding / is_pseudo=false
MLNSYISFLSLAKVPFSPVSVILRHAEALRQALTGGVDTEQKDEAFRSILKELGLRDGKPPSSPSKTESPPLDLARGLFIPAILDGLREYKRWTLVSEILNLLDWLIPEGLGNPSDDLSSLLFVEEGSWDPIVALLPAKKVVKTVVQVDQLLSVCTRIKLLWERSRDRAPSPFTDFSPALIYEFLPPHPILVQVRLPDKRYQPVSDEAAEEVLTLVKEAFKVEQENGSRGSRKVPCQEDLYVVFSDERRLKVKAEEKRIRRIHSARELLMASARSGTLNLGALRASGGALQQEKEKEKEKDFLTEIRRSHGIRLSDDVWKRGDRGLVYGLLETCCKAGDGRGFASLIEKAIVPLVRDRLFPLLSSASPAQTDLLTILEGVDSGRGKSGLFSDRKVVSACLKTLKSLRAMGALDREKCGRVLALASKMAVSWATTGSSLSDHEGGLLLEEVASEYPSVLRELLLSDPAVEGPPHCPHEQIVEAFTGPLRCALLALAREGEGASTAGTVKALNERSDGQTASWTTSLIALLRALPQIATKIGLLSSVVVSLLQACVDEGETLASALSAWLAGQILSVGGSADHLRLRPLRMLSEGAFEAAVRTASNRTKTSASMLQVASACLKKGQTAELRLCMFLVRSVRLVEGGGLQGWGGWDELIERLQRGTWEDQEDGAAVRRELVALLSDGLECPFPDACEEGQKGEESEEKERMRKFLHAVTACPTESVSSPPLMFVSRLPANSLLRLLLIAAHLDAASDGEFLLRSLCEGAVESLRSEESEASDRAATLEALCDFLSFERMESGEGQETVKAAGAARLLALLEGMSSEDAAALVAGYGEGDGGNVPVGGKAGSIEGCGGSPTLFSADVVSLKGAQKASVPVSSSRTQRISKGDFVSRAEELRTAAAQGLRAIEAVSSSLPQDVESFLRLTMIASTKLRLQQVLDYADVNEALLFQGATGVGKTALVMAAAALKGKHVVRVNLSSRTVVEDLVGSMTIKSDIGGGELFEFEMRPFATAFEQGHWLLLDELNLAPPSVLKALETALDTGVLECVDSSSASRPVRVMRRHPEFCLFATQNPATGNFRGKKDRLPQSFLERFTPVELSCLPDSELEEIVEGKFGERGLFVKCDTKRLGYAQRLVRFHREFERMTGRGDFEERAGYAEVSVRDLLRASEQLGRLGNFACSASEPELLQAFAFEIFCTYVSRFRLPDSTREALALVEKVWAPVSKEGGIEWEIKPGFLRIGRYTVGQNLGESSEVDLQMQVRVRDLIDSLTAGRPLFGEEHNDLEEAVVQATAWSHAATLEILFDKEFLQDAGLYESCDRWLFSWVSACIPKIKTAEDWGILGASLYASKVRHPDARDRIIEAFCSHFAEWGVEREKIEEEVLKAQTTPDKPLALTPRLLRTWHQVARALQMRSPPLLVGATGCGASRALTSLCELLDLQCSQTLLTPDTELAEIIGGYVPRKPPGGSGGVEVVWRNGVVTEAISEDGAVLLESLNLADTGLLEKLNPVLEVPPSLTLTEKGKTHPERIEGWNAEVRALVSALLPSAKEDATTFNRVISALRVICIIAEEQGVDAVSFRVLESLLSCAFQIDLCRERQGQPRVKTEETFFSAFLVVLGGQGADEAGAAGIPAAVVDKMQTAVRTELKLGDSCVGLAEDSLFTGSETYVLPPGRLSHIQAVQAGLLCGRCLLLEGPASVGKSTVVSEIRFAWFGSRDVARVNVTESTSLTDFFGSDLPDGKTVRFVPGALVEALRTGQWVLADELNLASPDVLSALLPILDGQTRVRIPGRMEWVDMHPDFRFIATQNPTSYGGRKRLPPSLLTRFVLRQIPDFSQEDLTEIISKRRDVPPPQAPFPLCRPGSRQQSSRSCV